MKNVRTGSARMRARWPRVAQALPLAFACAVMLILGPLAALAVGASSRGSGGSGFGTTTTKTSTTKTSTTKTSTTTTTTTTTTPSGVNTAGAPTPIAVPKNNPFARRALWIWVLSETDGGSLTKIIAQAKADNVGTLYIKSGDGTDNWPQFNPTLVAKLHAAGLRVCAWQYVYGVSPVKEAKIADDAVKEGADCMVIDAEIQYQGKYVQAQKYLTELRTLAGAKFPIALAGFPYVSYHLSFPYSVFLGPDGAQYNVPQMYWWDIGTTPENVYSVTYAYNEIYKRPIFPIGQLYPSGDGAKMPPGTQIEQFNTLAKEYAASGLSWYDWQSSTKAGLTDVTKTAALPKNFKRTTTAATVDYGNEGDLVVWAQEHLDGWIQNKTGSTKTDLTIDGDFGKDTRAAVEAFQLAHKLSATGVINGATWDKLLKVTPATVTWVTTKSGVSATAARAKAESRGGDGLVQVVPKSASLKSKRNELGGDIGAGRP